MTRILEGAKVISITELNYWEVGGAVGFDEAEIWADTMDEERLGRQRKTGEVLPAGMRAGEMVVLTSDGKQKKLVAVYRDGENAARMTMLGQWQDVD